MHFKCIFFLIRLVLFPAFCCHNFHRFWIINLQRETLYRNSWFVKNLIGFQIVLLGSRFQARIRITMQKILKNILWGILQNQYWFFVHLPFIIADIYEIYFFKQFFFVMYLNFRNNLSQLQRILNFYPLPKVNFWNSYTKLCMIVHSYSI